MQHGGEHLIYLVRWLVHHHNIKKFATTGGKKDLNLNNNSLKVVGVRTKLTTSLLGEN